MEIKTYSIIYNAIEEIKSAMEGMLEPKIQEKILANVEVREVYKFDKATVAGCFVMDGKIARNARIRIIRDGIGLRDDAAVKRLHGMIAFMGTDQGSANSNGSLPFLLSHRDSSGIPAFPCFIQGRRFRCDGKSGSTRGREF